MSGYCDECGNTECICKAIAASGDGVSLDWSALVAERDRLRAENARLTSEVERLTSERDAYREDAFKKHDDCVGHRRHARLCKAERAALVVVAAAARAFAAQYPWQGAPEIAPLIAALDAAGGEGKL